MLHATDCWVAQLGVPVSLDVWAKDGAADTTAGLQRASRAIPLSEIRPYVVDIGNNGKLSDSGDYWTTEKDLERLFESIREQTKTWSKRRVMLYLHGGLNKEDAVARRVVAFRDVCLENEIYPIHIMWETGFWESLKSSILDLFTNEDERAGAEWLSKLRDGVVDAKDRTIEITAAGPGTRLWDEMKENARLSSVPGGGMSLLAKHAVQALSALTPGDKKKWELHVVAHSAGSIFAAYAIDKLVSLGANFSTMQFLAPAITVEAFKRLLLPDISKGRCPRPTIYALSDVGERDDTCGPYGKSLLYLVSNAFEGQRDDPDPRHGAVHQLVQPGSEQGARRQGRGNHAQEGRRRSPGPGDRRRRPEGGGPYADLVAERDARRLRQRRVHDELGAVPDSPEQAEPALHAARPPVLTSRQLPEEGR